jgi:hypothetical protein
VGEEVGSGVGVAEGMTSAGAVARGPGEDTEGPERPAQASDRIANAAQARMKRFMRSSCGHRRGLRSAGRDQGRSMKIMILVFVQ